MTSQKMYTRKRGDDMQHWKSCKVLLYLNVILMMVLSLAFIGCGDDHGDVDGRNVVNINAEEFALTAQNVAALEGLSFTFDAGLFDPARAGQTATLTFGENNTFVLAIDGTTINGRITFPGSCRLRELEGEFNQTFDPCDSIVDAQNVPVGACTTGDVSLRLGTVVSDATATDVCINENGSITIGGNDVPLGTGSTGGTGG
jgi:hypothetical protein